MSISVTSNPGFCGTPVPGSKVKPGGWCGTKPPVTAETMRAVIDELFAKGLAKSIKGAPEGAEKPHRTWNVTPPGLACVYSTAHEIDGRLYMSRSGLGGYGQWYDCGQMPKF